MITFSLSHALWELQATAVRYPATTKPWFSGTLLAEGGNENAHLQSFVSHSGVELAAHLHASGGELVHLLAGIPYRDGWDIRPLAEVNLGKVGESTMVVVRDSGGNEFCPDAPQLSPSLVNQLVQVASVVTLQRPKRDDPLLSLGLVVHYLAEQKTLAAAEAPAPAAQASV